MDCVSSSSLPKLMYMVTRKEGKVDGWVSEEIRKMARCLRYATSIHNTYANATVTSAGKGNSPVLLPFHKLPPCRVNSHC